ncbi:MAG: iron ABC transporter permease, partial [Alphaproteobacteria bacterium]|nr:iron ABC transporter permease [Alphaproteobacteria bacterium]
MNRPTLATLGMSLLALLLASMVLAVTFGPADIAPMEVWQTIAHHLGLVAESPVNRLRDAIIWELRLPRVLTAAAVG